jgi:hypothetical protein
MLVSLNARQRFRNMLGDVHMDSLRVVPSGAPKAHLRRSVVHVEITRHTDGAPYDKWRSERERVSDENDM